MIKPIKSLASAITHKIANDIGKILTHSRTNEIPDNIAALPANNSDNDISNKFVRYLTSSIHR